MPGEQIRKTVTVLFADVTGSTALGERLDPESLRQVMSRYFEEMRAVLEHHGGTVEKFIGDAVMAVFGIPTLHEDDALRACRAAAEMQQTLVRLNESLGREFDVQLQARIGVNTGQVVAGDSQAGQTLVTGDAVNVAARLEQAADPGQILMGESTFRLVRGAVRAERIAPLELKGKAEPVLAYRLEEVTPGAPAFARRLDSPMVGREAELAALDAALQEATSAPACRVVTIVGDAGMGKSRLVNEFLRAIEDRATVLTGRCLPYGEGITFWPVAEALKAAAGITDEDSSEAALAKLEVVLAEIEDAHVVRDRIAAVLGLGGSGGEIQETFWAIRRALEALAGDRPLVLVLDDIHWAEPVLLDLLAYLAGFGQDHPLLLACTARPDLREARPDWSPPGPLLALGPLSEEQSQRLIENLLGRAGLAEEVRTRITEAAEGNPLFVEEMLRMLIDDGLLVRDDGHWEPAGDLSDTAVPATIQALLSARLDRLQGEERAVIQRASVVGKIFYWGAVAELSPEEARPSVGGHLQTLMRKELVLPDRSAFAGEDAFRFSHILVRDAAYESMPKGSRAELHERFAGWLERKAGDRMAEYEEIIGYHLEQATLYRSELGPLDERGREVGVTAARHLTAAGRRVLSQGDVAAAVNLLGRAADLLPSDDPARPAVLSDRGAAMFQTDPSGSQLVLAEAVEAARGTGDRRSEALAQMRLFWARLFVDSTLRHEEALAESERIMPILLELGDQAGLAEVRRMVGTVHFWAGRAEEAEGDFEQALAHARNAGDATEESEALKWLAIVIAVGPSPAGVGIRRLEQILDRAGGNPRVELAVLRSRTELEAGLGRIDQARALVARSKALARELGDQVAMAASVLRHSGYVEMLAGDPTAAERELRASYETLDRLGDIGHLGSVAPDLGEVLYAQGRLDEASRVGEVSRVRAIVDDMDAQIRWRILLGKVWARRRELQEAEKLVGEAVHMALKTDYTDLRAHALVGLGEVLALAGRSQDAAQRFKEAIAEYEQKENVVLAARTRDKLGDLDG